MRTLKALIAATAMLAALLPAAVASAGPHAPPDNFHTECTVDGSVELRDGVTPNRADDHYTFIDTALECETVVQTKAPKDYSGTWNVVAEGDTTDENHQGIGENCEFGGSTEVSGELHTGVLDAVRAVDDKTLDGQVHFVRVGTTVLADGPLQDPDNNVSGYFHAELEFIPTQGTCTKDDPITEAALIGGAVIDNGKGHDCLTDADKFTNDPHCN